MFKDEVINNIVISLSFADRIKVLLGRKIMVHAYTKTENVVGKVEGSSTVSVGRFFKQRQTGGYTAIDV